MRFLANVLWFLLGGLMMALSWWFAGILAFLSIVGIPWARSCFVIGQFALFPFGKEAINRKDLNQRDDLGTGLLGSIGNVVWFVFAGVWIALGHLGSALLCFATIIGIPFGIQHLKLAGLALAPVGKTVVTNDIAEAARVMGRARAMAGVRGRF
ncbi:YccF domain-containing protein [Chondromyces crocatus]|uniref:Membrane protein n=1 Tax=Chondromyces crocatus TaxID=52 RepID=A0A0K1EET5_CHOCO|nr:YccF domain-containing protein [Chondromyces crocatus]AKT39369.1 membrane protein [Chondromyces crocatus]